MAPRTGLVRGSLSDSSGSRGPTTRAPHFPLQCVSAVHRPPTEYLLKVECEIGIGITTTGGRHGGPPVRDRQMKTLFKSNWGIFIKTFFGQFFGCDTQVATAGAGGLGLRTGEVGRLKVTFFPRTGIAPWLLLVLGKHRWPAGGGSLGRWPLKRTRRCHSPIEHTHARTGAFFFGVARIWQSNCVFQFR